MVTDGAFELRCSINLTTVFFCAFRLVFTVASFMPFEFVFSLHNLLVLSCGHIHKTSYDNFTTKTLWSLFSVLWHSKLYDSNIIQQKNSFVL